MERFDDKTVARLLLSIKPPARGIEKPLNPIEIAKLLNEACKYESREEVAKELGINRATVRQYLHLLRLPKNVQKLIKPGKIGMDKGYRISLLKDKEDQRCLANAILQENLANSEVRGVVFLKTNNPQIPINDCVQKVIRQRKKVKRHLVLTGIDTSTLERLKREGVRRESSVEDLAKEIVETALPTPNSLIAFEMRGKLIKMVVDSDGFRTLRDKAKKRKVSFDNLVERLVEDWLQEDT